LLSFFHEHVTCYEIIVACPQSLGNDDRSTASPCAREASTMEKMRHKQERQKVLPIDSNINNLLPCDILVVVK